jgi:thioredoxin reductase
MEATTSPDCVVVGGGAAGLSAALVLGRARRPTLVIDAGHQSNLPARGIGGLLGHDGRPPSELYALGRDELGRYPAVAVRDARVVGGRRTADGFALALDDGTEVEARRVLLALGMDYLRPDVPGLEELWGSTVFHCPYCHGWEVRDGRLAVLGVAGAAHRALLLRGWSADVVVLTGGAALDAGDRETLGRTGVPVDERPIARLRAEDGRLAAVVFEDGDELARDGILAHVPVAQRSGLGLQLGATLREDGTVDADRFGRTLVPGLYAAGDAATFPPAIAAAIAGGSMAAAILNGEAIAAEHGLPPMLPPREG